MDFFPILFNALNSKYQITGMPPFVGEFSDKSELPPDLCQVPFYFWQKPSHTVVFSCNTPLIEDFAATLAINERLRDVTIGDILDAIDLLVKLKSKTFGKALQIYFDKISE